MTLVAGPQPGEWTCDRCEPFGTWGIGHVDDPRVLGPGDRNGVVRDPLLHAADCPRLSSPSRREVARAAVRLVGVLVVVVVAFVAGAR